MKISYVAPIMGACALFMYSSCRSTDGDMYTEVAVPMSEMEVADGQIPPWLLEDDGTNGAQVNAGTHTPVASNNRLLYGYPEPDEVAAVTKQPAAGSSRQNQPKLQNTDIPEIEPGVDPLSNTPITGITTTTGEPGKTASGSQGKTGGKRSQGSSTKPKTPTMVTYKVRPGDSLSLIASRSNTTVAQIMKDSKLKSTTIHPGQTIKVRYTPKGYKATKDTKGSSGKTKGSSGKTRTHTVAAGQTVSSIAAKYGVSTASLMKANGLTQASARKILPGRKLTIPAKR